MPAIVMENVGDGDYTFHLVDDALWDQIVGLSSDTDPYDDNEVNEIISWLTLDADDRSTVHRPEHAPDPAGSTIMTCYAQSGVIEACQFTGTVRGFLSLRL